MHLLAKLLPNDGDGRLAGPKALQTRGPAQLLQARGNFLVDPLGGHLHLHAALQLADTLHRNLHVDPLKHYVPIRGWCERRDSNSHGFPHQVLSLARLPIPPHSHRSSRVLYRSEAGSAGATFAHQQPRHFAHRRQAVLQHEVKWAISLERRGFLRTVDPGPGAILGGARGGERTMNVRDQRGAFLLHGGEARRLTQTIAREHLRGGNLQQPALLQRGELPSVGDGKEALQRALSCVPRGGPARRLQHQPRTAARLARQCRTHNS